MRPLCIARGFKLLTPSDLVISILKIFLKNRNAFISLGMRILFVQKLGFNIF